MEKTRREGVAKQAEAHVSKAKRGKSDGRAASDARCFGAAGYARGEAARESVSDEAGCPQHVTESKGRRC